MKKIHLISLLLLFFTTIISFAALPKAPQTVYVLCPDYIGAGGSITYMDTDGDGSWDTAYYLKCDGTIEIIPIADFNTLIGIGIGYTNDSIEDLTNGTISTFDLFADLSYTNYIGYMTYNASNGDYEVFGASSPPKVNTNTNIKYSLGSLEITHVYPNPAIDEIEVTGIENTLMQEIEIFNMLGEKVITQSIHPMTSSHRMNVGHLPTGMYVIKIGDRVTKFIKE